LTTLTKQQACELLHISSTTLWRRCKAGVYKFTKAPGQFGELTFTHADLGLDDGRSSPIFPEVRVTPAGRGTLSVPRGSQSDPRVPESGTPAVEPKRNAAPSKVGHYEDEPQDRAFADAYLAGEVADSAGNKIDGTNVRYSQSQSLTANRVEDGAPVSRTGTAHMDQRLLSDYVDPNFAPLIPLSTARLAAGYSQDQYDTDMVAWRRSGGGRSESEMEQQIRRSKQAISRSFPR